MNTEQRDVEPDGLDRALHEVFEPGPASSVLGHLDPEGKAVSHTPRRFTRRPLEDLARLKRELRV